MEVKFKLNLLVGLLITLMLLTTACLSGDDGSEDELVWKTKSTATFAVKYPSQWLVADGDPSVFGNAIQDLNDEPNNGLVGLDGVAFRESTATEAAIFAVIALEASTSLDGPGVVFAEAAVNDIFDPNDDKLDLFNEMEGSFVFNY